MYSLDHFIGNVDEFPILTRWDFYNHAGVSPLPRRAAEAFRAYAAQARYHGYLNADWYQRIEKLRASAAKLINASVKEIAFIKNTSEGLSWVARGIDWKAGDRIITTNVEYPANIYPWMELARESAVELVMVPEQMLKEDGQTVAVVPIERILEAAEQPGTRMITLSHVEFASGQRHDLKRIGQFCRERGILFCVDAIQTLGVIPVDVREMNIDYLAADGHKWLLGPEGAGLFYIREELIDRTRPTIVGWMNVTDAENFANYHLEYKPDARRYEAGSHNVPGFLALKASLELLQEFGIDNIARRVKLLGDRLIQGLGQRAQIISPRNHDQWSGSVCFTLPGHDHEALAKSLRADHIELALRNGRLRCSPHFYNTEAQIDRLVQRLIKA